MSPAGGWPQLRAAIEAGADAVYFGLNHFSARAKVGFDLAELPNVFKTLHRRGVRGFVTFNTLVFDHEVDAAKQAIETIAAANADAIIVQDVGIARLAREIAPQLALHGSTQMSITSAQGAELAKSLGCNRVVLGRELSLTDIRKIASQTDVELECFVHGALCVSYSGQCFSSEAWGGRSANRGQCAQACRLSYDLIVDGNVQDLGPHRYLLSPGDLYAIEQIPELIDIGVSCLKIEGRYKDADYVAATTRAYREAIDLAVLKLPNDDAPQEKEELEQIYSRGLGAHFISGVNHQTAVIGRAPRHRGRKVAVVVEVGHSTVDVKMETEIEPGDGLVFDAADWRSPDEPEEGGSVYTVKSRGGDVVRLGFEHDKLDFDRIRIGDWVWRTNQPSISKSLKPITKAGKPAYTRPLSFEVSARQGQPLVVTAIHHSGLKAQYTSESNLVAAEKRALDDETLLSKLGRLGGTPFHIGAIVRLDHEEVFVPTSVLNEARRILVEALLDAVETRKPGGKHSPVEVQELSFSNAALSNPATDSPPRLHLLVRTAEQLDAAINVKPDSITLDYLELYGLRPSVEKIQAAGLVARVASPRILKPSEQNIVRFLTSLEAEIVVRSGGLLADLLKTDVDRNLLIGDFSLNVANRHTVDVFRAMGLTRLAPTYDLNAKQIADLAACSSMLEVIAYSHLPVFHTEHCVFCRFLSEGTDHTNCGHPCEKHRIAVRDHQGRQHPVMADVGCRNTVFGAQAQTNPQAIADWLQAGIRNFRLEFVYQTPEQIEAIAGAFGEHLNQSMTADELNRILTENSPQSITEGSLFVPPGFDSLVQLK